jgi:DNA-binding Lrp family transcriptional regulator
MSGKPSNQTAYILLNTEIKKREDAIEKLRKIENVKEVYPLYGVYDCIVCVEAPNMDKLKETVTWRIAKSDNVRSISDMVVLRDSEGKPIGFKKDPKTGKFIYKNTPDKYRITSS